MSNTSTSEAMMSLCANCGKGEDTSCNLKACTACKMVKYCNRECQIAHRPQHKKECKKRAKEIHDEKLFKQPPPDDDCPICFLRLPTLATGRTYMACCGKVICCGCIHAVQLRAALARRKEDDICPFCRTPPPTTDEELIKRFEKRIELNDARAMHDFGCYHAQGYHGLAQNYAKALELWHRGGELGCAASCSEIAYTYDIGDGVERDKTKALYYWELSAMNGSAHARLKLGVMEEEGRNYDRALKHFMIAAKDGDLSSLKNIQIMFMNRDATKDDYADALRSYHACLDEIKSNQRDEAAASKEKYKYYESE